MENNNELPVSLTDIQNQINKLNDMLNEKYSKLVEDEEYLEQEKAKFASTHKILMTFKDPIKLNVGGQIFMTSRSTLMKEDSMFKSMFSGHYKLEIGEDGAYFIDRDPKYFGEILNFLRDGEFEMNDDEAERRKLLREVEFYCISTLVKYLEIQGSPRFTVQDPKTLDNTTIWNETPTEIIGQRKPVTGSFAGNVKTRIRVDDDDEKPVERKQHLDPERMDKSTLKMELTTMKVVLPTKDSPRKVYVDLFKKSMNNKLTTDLQKKTDALEKAKSHAQKQTEQLQQEVKSLQKQLASEGDSYRNRLMQADKEIIAALDAKVRAQTMSRQLEEDVKKLKTKILNMRLITKQMQEEINSMKIKLLEAQNSSFSF